ncbi:ABC transporter substrate-binding protein [Micromonospora sp. CPCC 206060]|uniref:ABC transporter substrate-binding protein n=1 Tax=Micromonospora sp. CPCC 206060 TaxID=3122406 RepID=UPI002FEE8B14
MSPIRSATIAALASAVLATTLTGCQFGAEEQDASPIVIGADLELSGSAAPIGRAYQRALELKVEQLNESGALGARKIDLRVKDNRSDPAESLRNIDDFAEEDAVTAVIMGSCNACAVGAAKTVSDRKVPTIALAPAGAVASPVVDRRYMFKLAPNAADTAAVLAADLKRQRIKKVALLHSDDDYGREGLQSLTAELAKAQIKLTGSQSAKATDTDLSGPVRKLVDENPGALIVWTPAEQARLVHAGAEQAKFTGPLFLDAAAAGDLFMGGGHHATNNTTLIFTQTMVIDDVIATTPAKAARRQWFRDYTARFGGYYGFSSFAADAVQLIVDAVGRSGTGVDRDGVRSVLETSQMDGLSGPIRITPDNHSGLMPQALTTLVSRGGRWRLAG